MLNNKNYKTFFVANTKGGVGKSFISNYILPFYFLRTYKNNVDDARKNLRISEIDSTSESRESQYSKSLTKYNKYHIEIEKEIKSLYTNIGLDNDKNNIIDCAPNGTFFEALQLYYYNPLCDDTLFIIPFSSSYDALTNALDTCNYINEIVKDAKILFVLNNLDYSEINEVKKYNDDPLNEEQLLHLLNDKRLFDYKKTFKNFHLSYIMHIKSHVANKLFKEVEGSSLDFCEDFINERSIIDSHLKNIELKKSLYQFLKSCNPFFDKIDEIFDS